MNTRPSTERFVPGTFTYRSRTDSSPETATPEDGRFKMYRRRVPADFTLTDQSGKPWTLSDHLDAAALLVFLRGDW